MTRRRIHGSRAKIGIIRILPEIIDTSRVFDWILDRDLCTGENGLEYMLPADKTLYPVFAELDPVYEQLYDMVSDENNGIFRYNSNFYEEFDLRKAYLSAMITS